MSAYKKLQERLLRVAHLKHTSSMLKWDEAVMMPKGGVGIRSESLATLNNLIREELSKKENLMLIQQAKEDVTLNAWEKTNLDLIEKQVKISINTPEKLLIKMTESSIVAEQAWRSMREENNWKDFKPLLEKNINFVREYSNILGETLGLSPYDAMIDLYSPGVTQSYIDPIFNTLEEKLPDLLVRSEEKQKTLSTIKPSGPFNTEAQKRLSLDIMQSMGFNMNKGRLDTSHHPFCGDDPEDTRITTNYSGENFLQSLLGTCHETGHALYQFSLPEKWRRQPVGSYLGMSVHESQSLLMEMHACRSKEFTRFISPKLISLFGYQEAFEPRNLYNVFTSVKRDFIRIDADEVTYPFHVILRYELEKNLIGGNISVDDLPERWNTSMKNYLGINPKDDYAKGVMQDVHWPSGTFGYFPAYALGSLIAAQLFHNIKKDNTDAVSSIENGDFSGINSWLDKSIRSHGSLYGFDELLIKATGESLNANYFLDHVEERYC